MDCTFAVDGAYPRGLIRYATLNSFKQRRLDDETGDWRLVTQIVVRDGIVPAFRLYATALAEV
jgi:hypothetical protein